MSIRLNENFDNSTPFLKGYKQLKIPIMDNAGNPAWPEMFPINKIHELETVVGPRHFSAQMMLEYVAEERIHLDPGAINFYDAEFDSIFARIENYEISGAAFYWDPSSGRVNSDGSVCVLIYRDDKTSTVFVHDILYTTVSDEDMYPLANQCETVLNFMKKHNIGRIGIEINGIGNALPEIIRNTALKKQMAINIIQISNHIKKETRILNAIEPILMTGRLYMHERIKQTMLLSEMLAWTPMGSNEHDDGLDALSGALAMNPFPIRAINKRNQIIHANTDFKI
jgi:predicted phage terminase large subunit-like protein